MSEYVTKTDSITKFLRERRVENIQRFEFIDSRLSVVWSGNSFGLQNRLRNIDDSSS